MKTDIAKLAISFIVGSGVAIIVKGIVENNTDAQGVVDKTATWSASTVLGMMTADACKNYTDAQVDAVVEWWNNRKTIS